MDRATEIRAEIARLEKWMLTWEFQAHAQAVAAHGEFDANAEWLDYIADLRDELNDLEDAETEMGRAAA